MDKQDLYYTLDKIHAWTENCDAKASIIIGSIGVVVTILLSSDYLNQIKTIVDTAIKYVADTKAHPYDVGSIVYLVVLLIASIILIIGCFYLFRVLVPKTKPSLYKQKGMTLKSLIFFHTISRHKSYERYKTNVANYNNETLLNDITSQIYVCSKICTMKFSNYKKGLAFSLIGLALNISLVILGFIAF